MTAGLIALLVVILFIVVVLVRSIRIIPQARAGVVERLGSYSRTLLPGPHVLIPFADRVRATIDLREQVVSFPPQPVITADNLTVNIDTVIYFQVTDPRAATYEIANYIQAVEQLTVTTLRNVVGSMNLEQTLTSRDQINSKLRGELDEATGKWGIRVARVELKAIDPPLSIQDAMEKQMRADRDKRAIILQAEGARESSIKTAEGQKAAQILAAEGGKQSAILAAEAERQSRILRAEGERAARYLAAQGQAKAIETVFASIHAADPDPKLLAYQYLQTLPQIAQGDANKLWIIPSEFSQALQGLAGITGQAPAAGAEGNGASWLTEAGRSGDAPSTRPPYQSLDTEDWFDSKLPPARLQPEAEIRASDRDSETAAAHSNLSFDVPDGADDPTDEDDAPRALPPSQPAPYAGPPSGQQQPTRHGPPSGGNPAQGGPPPN
ncbi:MAG TPA: SPFH domain-containing protein [Mycobacteriales bacterium]|jgi:regulator of protease activity HflC (stomatin/prohibitin superfamily)|nr:SPFH domain-containing protein [Mycobacteriales bacterium]